MSLRSRVAPLLKTALFQTGGYGLVRRLAPSRNVAILRYHAICDDAGFVYADPGICISPDAFESHCRYLAAHYNVMALPDVADRIRRGLSLPTNAVVITFDDGYADNLPAARTLQRHGLSATFFITSDCLKGGEPFWPAELRALIAAVTSRALELQLPNGSLSLPLADSHDRAAAVRKLSRTFKSHPVSVRESLRQQLRAAAGHPEIPSFMLTWTELAEMDRLGMTIGAHTRTHPNLPSAGLETAAAEISGSKARLERELGHPVTMFSYPNGGAERYYTPELQKEVARHFAAAASSRNAFANASSDLYALERIEVEERLEDLVFALEVERFVFAPR